MTTQDSAPPLSAEYRPGTGIDPVVHFSDGAVVRFALGQPTWLTPPAWPRFSSPPPALTAGQAVPAGSPYAVQGRKVLVEAGILPEEPETPAGEREQPLEEQPAWLREAQRAGAREDKAALDADAYQKGREAGIEEGRIQGRQEANRCWDDYLNRVKNALYQQGREVGIQEGREQVLEQWEARLEEPGAEPEAEAPEPG